ncbi:MULTISPECIES: LytTR family DNA-binding domain-containing protein [Arcicella]|uniref:LytTR family DNA-binding domain-containing protein n=1 Tax=Arcicella aquatica TaxID=217141 RepID=A0ABU5QT25_9BACT|nr:MULTISPECIES: LytTR family DNA-binding domain-containing protein [Arcicella]MDR6561077.1 DNA-binding LytR/AlgR family response regulator [Arcicella sp. BE51]MDR6810961.1 DNA-binding LytR/AlgR family response regulator [Arcicella sp. BE140]MDR6822311.1 DNA-binding LytR/AlgR family response regulator [Arcicella sp. BE139]MEA5259804.1 LytTR family DNA-binding domain-containing protein [Arcicella aquatica]
MTAIAIDDEPKALEVIEIHASKIPFLDLKATFTDAFEAIPYLQNNKIDLIFLDIKMPDISGIEFVHCLQKVPMVIFTTAYSEYAVQGFELDALDYLLKPFSLARFMKACNKALSIKQLKEGEERDFIFIKTGYEEEKVFFDDILYIEAEGNYLTFMLKNGKLLSRQTMSDILQVLPEKLFVRIHRSYIIAYSKVEKIARQTVSIQGIEIPIGASYEDNLDLIKDRLKG